MTAVWVSLHELSPQQHHSFDTLKPSLAPSTRCWGGDVLCLARASRAGDDSQASHTIPSSRLEALQTLLQSHI